MLLAFRTNTKEKDVLSLLEKVKERKKYNSIGETIRFCIEYAEINTRG